MKTGVPRENKPSRAESGTNTLNPHITVSMELNWGHTVRRQVLSTLNPACSDNSKEVSFTAVRVMFTGKFRK